MFAPARSLGFAGALVAALGMAACFEEVSLGDPPATDPLDGPLFPASSEALEAMASPSGEIERVFPDGTIVTGTYDPDSGEFDLTFRLPEIYRPLVSVRQVGRYTFDEDHFPLRADYVETRTYDDGDEWSYPVVMTFSLVPGANQIIITVTWQTTSFGNRTVDHEQTIYSDIMGNVDYAIYRFVEEDPDTAVSPDADGSYVIQADSTYQGGYTERYDDGSRLVVRESFDGETVAVEYGLDDSSTAWDPDEAGSLFFDAESGAGEGEVTRFTGDDSGTVCDVTIDAAGAYHESNCRPL